MGAVAVGSVAAGVRSAEEFVAPAFAAGSDDWRRYQVAPAAASTIPAAIAVISIALLMRGAFAGAAAVAPSRVRPKTGAATGTAARFVGTGTWVVGGGAAWRRGPAALNSSTLHVLALDVVAMGALELEVLGLEALEFAAGSGGAGIAALRANGWSHAGIFTSSASNAGALETGAFGAGITDAAGSSRSERASALLSVGSLAAISKILAVASLRAP